MATMPLEWGNGGLTDLSFSMNFNETEFDSDPSDFLNAEDQFDFENENPEWRSVLTARHTMDAFSFLVRANFFGGYEDANNSGPDGALEIQEYDPLVMFDLEGSYRFNESLSLTVGGRNIFDEYPDEADEDINDYCCGRIYSSNSIVPWQGGYYFARLNYDF